MTPPAVDDALLEPVLASVQGDAAAPWPPWPETPDDAARLGWALKTACYETWNTAPARADRAAGLLHELATARQSQVPVLHALACWTRGIAELGAGRMAAALEALDAAAAAFETLGDVAHAAQTQVPKLMALSVLGRHDEALHCAQTTLAQFIASGDQRSAGKIELNVGTMLFRQDRHAEACRHYRSAAQRFAAVQDVEQSVLADIGLANALTWLFDFDEALRVNQRARQLADAHGYAVLSAQARGSIGQLELNRGQPQRALPELAAACRLLEQVGGLPQRLAEVEIALADAYLAVNLLPEAVTLYDRIAVRCAEHDVAAEQARVRLQRAQALARLGEFDRAEADLAAARRLFEAQDNPASAALAGMQLADLELKRGQAPTARAGALAAAQVFDAHALPGWRCEAEVLAAEACAAGGDGREARRRFEAALALPGAASHTDWRCRVGLAALERAAGRRGAALAQLEQALAVIEAQRAALPGDEFRTAFGADKVAAFDALIDLAWQALRDVPGAEAASARLWQALERARGRALALGLALGPERGNVAVDADGDALRTRLQWTRDQVTLALADGDVQAAASFGRQALALEQQLLEAWRLAQAAAPVAGATDSDGDAPPSLAELQAALMPGDAWVQYHRLDRRWIAAVVTRERVHWAEGDASGLDERIEALRFQLEALRGAGPALQAHAAQLRERTRRHLQALHRQLWAPLADAVGASTRVFVVPHRNLHYLPFAALHDGRQWLVERHELVLVPSATVWMAARRHAPARHHRLLALGVGGPALRHVEPELRAVARHFGAGAMLRLGTEATRAALHDAAPAADVLHLACHAQFRADSPYFSALHLADGELSLRDAAALPLAASLVTLSACETGLSRVAPGDELVGLVRGFLLAGAPNVLATLWTVDDASTAALMAAFYAGLCAGARPAAALRAAQSAAAIAGRHPFYWAAFALHGRD